MIPEKVKIIENKYMKKEMPKIMIGDTVKVNVKIVEEGKTRIQVFEGIVIRMQGEGMRKTVTVRRISYGEGVERTFPVNSPFVDKITTLQHGKIRRAKLYFLRGRKGKKAVLKEKRA